MQTSCKQTENYQSRIIKELEAAPDKPFKIFSEFDDDMIRKYYIMKGSRTLARILNKKPTQVQARAAKLGIRRL